MVTVAFVMGWIRSQTKFDSVVLCCAHERTKLMNTVKSDSLISVDGSLVWERAIETVNGPNYNLDFGMTLRRERWSSNVYKFADAPPMWRWRFWGLGIGDSRLVQGIWTKESTYFFVPYGLVVTLLGLVTAILLTSKRRPANQQNLKNLPNRERSIFDGWRRKVGLVSLVMALLILGCLMRSDAYIDEWNFGSGTELRFSSLTNTRFGIVWSVRWTEGQGQLIYQRGWHPISYSRSEFELDQDFNNPFFKVPYPLYLTRRWDLCGLGSGEFHSGLDERDTQRQRMTFWIVPFGMLLWPPTLTALWLLVRWPRGVGQSKAAEAVAETA